MAVPVAERFWTKVDFTNTCWLWTAYRNPDGYGSIGTEGKRTKRAHVFAYEEQIGSIPPGMELDHLCRNRACVRPDHLEAVTHAENVARGDLAQVNASKTHCKRGHPYDEENTYVNPSGARVCKACRNIAKTTYNKRKQGRPSGW